MVAHSPTSGLVQPLGVVEPEIVSLLLLWAHGSQIYCWQFVKDLFTFAFTSVICRRVLCKSLLVLSLGNRLACNFY